MAYDWSGVQTRRNRRLRFVLLSLLALTMLTVPIVAGALIRHF
jgi:hypothetical protein